MKWLATQINALPSAWRHALFALLASELLVAANGFAGATTLADLKVAAGGVLVALVVGLARWAQQALSAPVVD